MTELEPESPPELTASPCLLPESRRRRGRVFVWLLLAALLAAAAWGGWKWWQWHQAWSQVVAAKPGLPPSGGKWFRSRLELEVPVFRQNDPRWGKDQLAHTPGDTLGSAGCAVASTAMVLASYGVKTDPQLLNDFLKTHNGFTPQGWLKWEAAAETMPEKVSFVYEGDPSFRLIDENLDRGNPVIVRMRYPSGITHFVVICGKEGLDYLIRDPGARAGRGLYPLKEFGSNIEALRFYEKR